MARRRRELAQLIASFIETEAKRFGETLKMPPMSVARLVLATSDGLQLAGFLDDDDAEDLYVPFLELLLGVWEEPNHSRQQRTRSKRTSTRNSR